jgi:hypothetical protein
MLTRSRLPLRHPKAISAGRSNAQRALLNYKQI